ncbi:MAG TPA: hypothetical protein VGO91_07125 [Pyrinomonadaceae bacterium]|jgi:hypothetical protein|nr:hypothetical protein [Pyrinomonadaceae bacterium]
MPSALLYSTNSYLKLYIQEIYRGDVHFVWCSEQCDSKTLSSYSPGALTAPSSNPADIYKELKRDVEGRDRHSAKINAQKARFTGLAITWEQAGEITTSQKDDIIYLVSTADFSLWRPLLYVIPRTSAIEPRLQHVPMAGRAGIGIEYKLPDLKRSEFEIIEL